jgi:hypothetical protein
MKGIGGGWCRAWASCAFIVTGGILYEGKLANVDLGDILISYSFGIIFFRQLKELGGS